MATAKKAARKKTLITKKRAKSKSEYSLKVLKAWEPLLTNIRTTAKKEKLIISIEHDDGFSIRLVNSFDKSQFFSVRLPDPRSSEYEKSVRFPATLKPFSESDAGLENDEFDAKSLLQYFERWINIIKTYGEIQLTPDEKFAKQYAAEFYDDFEIVDENADAEPFDYPRQVFLYKYLEYVEKVLNEQNTSEDISSIKEDVIQLRENLQNYTKKETISRLAKVLGKIRKKGISLLKKIYDELQKELIKRAIKYGLDNIDVVIKQITDAITP